MNLLNERIGAHNGLTITNTIRPRGILTMYIRLMSTTTLFAGMLLVPAAHAQDLVLQVDRDTGNFFFTGASASTVNLAAYRITSKYGTISPNDFVGIDESDWDFAGLPKSPAGVQQTNSNPDPVAGTPIDNRVSINLGAAYDSTQALADGGFGFDVEQDDLSLTYYDTVLDQIFEDGVIEYLGNRQYNNIGISVNLAQGTAFLKNDSRFDQVISGYLIEAATPGTLNTNLATFDGLRNEAGGGNFQPPTVLDGENISEADPTDGGIAINAGQSYSLGVIGGLLDDLTFSFLLSGTGEASRVGFVDYFSAAPIDGDFDGDGDVDGIDFLAWQRGDSPDPLSASDLSNWQSNYGSPGGSLVAATGAVPEPTSAVHFMLMLLIGAGSSPMRDYRNNR